MQVMKDKYLAMIISGIVGVSVFLLFLWTAIPPLRGMAVKERDAEDPYGETVSKEGGEEGEGGGSVDRSIP
jgi:hypothetical protein